MIYPTPTESQVKDTAGRILRNSKNKDARMLADYALYVLTVINRIEKEIHITGRIDDRKFELMIKDLDLEIRQIRSEMND